MTIAHPAGFRTVDAITFQGLFLPGKQRRYMTYTLLGGASYPIGTVLGLITASNKLTVCTAAAGDGSQVPFAVLPETVNLFDNAGNALDKSMSVIVEGSLNLAALQIDSSLNRTTVANQLRMVGILTDTPNYSG